MPKPFDLTDLGEKLPPGLSRAPDGSLIDDGTHKVFFNSHILDEPGTMDANVYEAFRTPTRIIVTEAHKIKLAMEHLRKARDLLIDAGASKTVERVRTAINSADGARRHAEHKQQRREARKGTI